MIPCISPSLPFLPLLLIKVSLSHSFQLQIPTSFVAKDIFESSMEKHHQDKEQTDLLRERCTKEACEFGTPWRLSDDILPHILNLYGSCASPRDFDIYAPNATFEDPLMRAQGVKQIKSAFYSIPKVFSESRIVEYSIRENIISPGKHEILIDNKQYYKLFGKGIDMISLITLHVEGGKIVRHEDWWNKNPIWNRESVKVPLVGRFMEIARRGSMLMTHAMMKFGEDPAV